MTTSSTPTRHLLALAAAGLLAGCGGDGSDVSVRPLFVTSVSPAVVHDGDGDDLLTAGLGVEGLKSATPPPIANAASPTAAELRKLAIHSNYRALVDTTAAGGFGTLYGPNVGNDGTPGTGNGFIAGTEIIGTSDDGSGERNVTLMVQVPTTFNPDKPCITTATSSGSRGIYGAIAFGEWGLKRGCAVAYTDKGTGTAPHDLARDTVPLIDGTRTTSAAAGRNAQFRAPLTAQELADFNAAAPNRFAFKHAHSQRNPEKDWGTYTLQAIEFAFWVLNERYGELDAAGLRRARIKPGNTIVIASSVSNGGAASLAAAELDTRGLIDGVAVGEPAVELPAQLPVALRRGTNNVATFGKPLYDYVSYANLYQACATQSSQLAGAPSAAFVTPTSANNRCASLRDRGLLAADSAAAQADEALQKLQDYGWEPESGVLQASMTAFEVHSAVAVSYASALARASVKERLCNFSFAAIDGSGAPTAADANAIARLFGTGNGVPPSAPVQLINDDHPAGPLRSLLSTSRSTGRADFNFDGALCLRDLVTGSGTPARALQAGIDEVRRSGNLRGKPAIIVHGRSDALIPVNHSSRPYTALNKAVEGRASQLSYIEVTNAQHFDAFIGNALLAGYDTRYVPLHVYVNRAMDAMWARLNDGTALPPSQLVRTVPRGGTPGAAPAISAANVPPIAAVPAAGDAITMSGTTLVVPE